MKELPPPPIGTDVGSRKAVYPQTQSGYLINRAIHKQIKIINAILVKKHEI